MNPTKLYVVVLAVNIVFVLGCGTSGGTSNDTSSESADSSGEGDSTTDIGVNTDTSVPGAGCDCDTGNCIGNFVNYSRDGQTIGFEFNCDGAECACGKFANG